MQNINLVCTTNADGQNCVIDGTDPYFTPFFSSGDIMLSVLLLLLIVIELIKLLRGGISSVRVVKEMQGNNTQDGKEFYKI